MNCDAIYVQNPRCNTQDLSRRQSGQLHRRTGATTGARFLLLISRSGLKDQSAIGLMKELEGKGAVVKALVCDIADHSALKSGLEERSATLPPIQGCFQAAMVLRVCYTSLDA
jgi:hypothetical protein